MRARARGTYIGSRCVWQRLKRPSTNTADDMRGELKAACRRERDQGDTSATWVSVAQQKMTKAANTSTNISTTDHLSTRQTLFTLDLSSYILLQLTLTGHNTNPL